MRGLRIYICHYCKKLRKKLMEEKKKTNPRHSALIFFTGRVLSVSRSFFYCVFCCVFYLVRQTQFMARKLVRQMNAKQLERRKRQRVWEIGGVGDVGGCHDMSPSLPTSPPRLPASTPAVFSPPARWRRITSWGSPTSSHYSITPLPPSPPYCRRLNSWPLPPELLPPAPPAPDCCVAWGARRQLRLYLDIVAPPARDERHAASEPTLRTSRNLRPQLSICSGFRWEDLVKQPAFWFGSGSY